jgi:hypothetical protein
MVPMQRVSIIAGNAADYNAKLLLIFSNVREGIGLVHELFGTMRNCCVMPMR